MLKNTSLLDSSGLPGAVVPKKIKRNIYSQMASAESKGTGQI